ncbi:MAG TPA: histidine kinase [Gemmatimonadaceae bacterium]|nr:histidine kinase [Gemmatimonadaceae bacterium]
MKLQFAWVYGCAWLVFYVLYALMLVTTPGTTILDSLRASFFTIVPAALLGLGAWKIAKALPWTDRRLSRLIAVHGIAAVVYAFSWAGLTALQIALFAPPSVLEVFMQRAAGWQLIMGLMIYGLIAGVAYLIQTANRLAEQRVLASRAELQVLRGQLNPHFLFNTLHSLTALVREDPRAAEDSLIKFGSLLRYVLDASRNEGDDATVEEELEFVRGYLAIEKMRLGSRLDIVEDIDPDSLDCTVPILTLQPLVENAIRHGIAPRSEGGAVRISAAVMDNDLVLTVSDNGDGTSDTAINTSDGVGLALVRKRIDTRYPDGASTNVRTSPGQGFTVTVRVPAQTTRAQREVSDDVRPRRREVERATGAHA